MCVVRGRASTPVIRALHRVDRIASDQLRQHRREGRPTIEEVEANGKFDLRSTGYALDELLGTLREREALLERAESSWETSLTTSTTS